jgi:hypothetical protein
MKKKDREKVEKRELLISTHLHSWSCLYVVFLHGSMLWLYNINILSMPFKFYPNLRVEKDDHVYRWCGAGVAPTPPQAINRTPLIFGSRVLHSWSCLYVVFLHGSMLWLYNINILSMPFKFYPKLHISYSCRALRESKILVRTHTQIPLSDLREPYEE